MQKPRIRTAAGRLTPGRLTLAHGLMILAGLVTFVAVSTALRDRRATVEVLVASGSLEDGRVVAPTDFTTVAIPASAALLDSWMLPTDQPTGQLTRPLNDREPLLRSDVVPVEAGLADRTFSVPIEPLALDGLGLVLGDQVDIVGISVDGAPRFVVEAVRVVRLPAEETAPSLGRIGSTFVTVEVDEHEILALVAALRVDAVEFVRSTGAPPIAVPVEVGP